MTIFLPFLMFVTSGTVLVLGLGSSTVVLSHFYFALLGPYVGKLFSYFSEYHLMLSNNRWSIFLAVSTFFLVPFPFYSSRLTPIIITYIFFDLIPVML